MPSFIKTAVRQIIHCMWLFLILCASSMLHAQDTPCPEGQVCIPEDRADHILEIVETQECMSKALDNRSDSDRFEYDIDPITIVQTDDDQTFVQGPIRSHLRWCDYNLTFKSKANLHVEVKETSGIEWSLEWSPKARIGAVWYPLAVDEGLDSIGATLMFQPIEIGILHPSAHVGIRGMGLGPAVDITSTTDAYVGLSTRWGEWTPSMSIGMSVRLW